MNAEVGKRSDDLKGGLLGKEGEATQSLHPTTTPGQRQGCQMAKFDPFLSLDCARVEGMGVQSKERKGSNFAVLRSGAIVNQALSAKRMKPKDLAIDIWQHCP